MWRMGHGTPLGDPVRCNAGCVWWWACGLVRGGVGQKPNVGHSLAASGLQLGLVVLACALRDGQGLRACCEPLSSYVDWVVTGVCQS